jgi:hypothetical protein
MIIPTTTGLTSTNLYRKIVEKSAHGNAVLHNIIKAIKLMFEQQ